MSAMSPKADTRWIDLDVRFVPIAVIAASLSTHEKPRRIGRGILVRLCRSGCGLFSPAPCEPTQASEATGEQRQRSGQRRRTGR